MKYRTHMQDEDRDTGLYTVLVSSRVQGEELRSARVFLSETLSPTVLQSTPPPQGLLLTKLNLCLFPPGCSGVQKELRVQDLPRC